MHLKLLASVLVIVSSLLTACETMTVSKQVAVNTTEKWALLPIKNLSKTPQAGDRARALIETHLRSKGVKSLELYQVPAEQSLIALLDDARQLEESKAWAIENGIRYAVTGNVQEWQYKNGLDNEPSVGLTLKFLDLRSDEVMWVASASRTGWGYSNLSSVASKTIDDLLDEVSFKRKRGNSSLALTAPAPVKKSVELPPIANNPSASAEPSIAAALPTASPTEGRPVTLTSGTAPTPSDATFRNRHQENISR